MISLSSFRDELVKLASSVKPYQQETQWTCSAACLKTVASYWGLDVSEKVAGVLIKVSKNRGAEVDQITNAAKKMGFNAYDKDLSMEEVKSLLTDGVPIICDIQSFKHPGKGHYVVLYRIEGNSAHLMDPNVEGNQRTISLKELEERWWDREMAPPHKMRKRWGVVITPKEG